ncbi:MAG: endonuclease/exonuclease/phosphatase family protein [Candidatus Eisenbacteria bacterium]|nr:endonuclease/exonuclease/phosphatase family protein [Candidatus Eisenbacteria bacterium]
MRRLIAAVLLASVLAIPPIFAEEIALATWNLLNYPGSTGPERAPYFRTVLGSLGPDVLVVQEMNGQSGVNAFLADVLEFVEPGVWSAGPFHDGFDTDRALFYRTGAIEVLGYGWLDTALRDIDWWHVRLPESGEEVRIYTLHLKASQGSDNEAKRLAECTILRNALDTLDADLPFVVAGDFNIYTASESAYQHLVLEGPGRLYDPIDQEGDWHDNAAYASIHTQSTRTTSFGGGATGGMDDRFDMILASVEMLDGVGLEIDADTYIAFGNDGAHLNQSIIQGGNAAVPPEVAEALHQSSDHVPLLAVLRAETSTSVAGAVLAAPLLAISPNPFNATATIRFTIDQPGDLVLVLYDAAGRRVGTLASGRFASGAFERSWDGKDDAGREAASGVYFARLVAGERSVVEKLVLIR